MRNQKGFTLVEMMVAAVIIGVVITASISAIVTYDQQEKRASRSLEVKKILLEISSDISNMRSSLPYFEINNSRGAYVLCYSKEGVLTPFSATEQIHLVAVSALGANPLCGTTIELRVQTEMTARDTIWTVIGGQRDPTSGKLLQYAPYVISRTTGF